MHKLLIATIAVAISVSANAEPRQITVTSAPAPTVDQWIDQAGDSLGKSIDREMRSITYRHRPASGITYVAFECSEDGTPINVRTSESGGGALDRVGVRVVERVNLHPVFSGHRKGQRFEAAILIAANEKDLARGNKIIGERARKAREEWAARGLPNPVVALAVAIR